MALSAKKRAKHREYMRRRYQNDPAHRMKQKARSAVSRAVKRGKMVKGACEVCGCVKVQAHHEDYTKPLVVRWFCKSHHENKHGGPGFHGN